jgi:arylsulfatase
LTVSIDGDVRATVTGLVAPGGWAPFEGIDVGCDRRSPVHWHLAEREGTFAYTGALHHVRYEPADLAPDAPQRRVAELIELAGK